MDVCFFGFFFLLHKITAKLEQVYLFWWISFLFLTLIIKKRANNFHYVVVELYDECVTECPMAVAIQW